MVNYHNLENIKNNLTLPKKYILSFALMLLHKNRIFSADPGVLQFIDAYWTLEWLPTNVHNSVHSWSSL